MTLVCMSQWTLCCESWRKGGGGTEILDSSDWSALMWQAKDSSHRCILNVLSQPENYNGTVIFTPRGCLRYCSPKSIFPTDRKTNLNKHETRFIRRKSLELFLFQNNPLKSPRTDIYIPSVTLQCCMCCCLLARSDWPTRPNASCAWQRHDRKRPHSSMLYLATRCRINPKAKNLLV